MGLLHLRGGQGVEKQGSGKMGTKTAFLEGRLSRFSEHRSHAINLVVFFDWEMTELREKIRKLKSKEVTKWSAPTCSWYRHSSCAHTLW
jgi:hypothetical protein